ncbi:transglycosylase domain-containing protein [Calidifontibacillus oryziterrae]|uniref:transglycosylase domain-containing protein n=1 Tax=Calidifontibacillus oryziterrae TaxID=1191699 RepID=UPI0002E9C098|nr:PBP1A family penicillin-binding protein [Calidifontibacillus oryziterrae]
MSEKYRTRQEKRNIKSNNKSNKKMGARKFLQRLFTILIILSLVGVIAITLGAMAFIKDAPKIDAASLEVPQSTKVYDRDKNLIAELGDEKRTTITYQEIPKILEDAVLATEDVRFYEHIGIDFKRIAGAVIANITDGFGSQGASTITQQVVKNAFLSPEKTWKRKIQEQYLAIQLDSKYSKQQILTMYLNRINYGNRAYGAAKAAEIYFGKELKDLELHEAALLAGLPQRPNGYDPYKYPEEAEKRRNLVLSYMEMHGKITSEQADEAKAIPVTSYIVEKKESSNPHDAFIDQVLEEIEQIEDIDIQSSGVSIYTTLDAKTQSFVEKVLNTDDYITYPDERFQAGIVVLDTKTGEVLAIGGGRNQSTSYFATDIKRQPGSTAKPIFDYGPAIEYLKWSTYHQIVDEPHSYTNGPAVNNWDGGYKGQMSIRDALADSRNIPALKTFQEVGPAKSRAFAASLGIQVEDRINEAYSIGGFNGTSPLDQAGAYSAFGNNGVYTKPHTILKIVFPDGREINMKPESKVVMKEYTAFMVTDMLKSVMHSGTGRSANVSGVHIAGKTGTTNYENETRQKYNIPKSAVPDSWFTGYSPDYTISVWTGYNEHSKENYISSKNQGISKQLFKVIMTEISKGKKQRDFVMPTSVIKSPVVKGSNPPMLPSTLTPEDMIVYEYFVKGTEPTEVSDEYDTLPPVENADIQYFSEANLIQLSWSYDEKLLENVSFVVNQAINNGEFTPYWTGKELTLVIPDPYVNSIYGFEIYAIDDANPELISEPILLDVETLTFDDFIPDINDPLDPFDPNEPEKPRNPSDPAPPNDNISNTKPDEGDSDQEEFDPSFLDENSN